MKDNSEGESSPHPIPSILSTVTLIILS